MDSKGKIKPFDAVKMMRGIRDKISAETQSMTLEQLKEYIKKQTRQSGLKSIGRLGE